MQKKRKMMKLINLPWIKDSPLFRLENLAPCQVPLFVCEKKYTYD